MELARFIVNNRLVLGPADAMRYFHNTLTTLVKEAKVESEASSKKAAEDEETMTDLVRKAELQSRKGGEPMDLVLRRIAGEDDARRALSAIMSTMRESSFDDPDGAAAQVCVG